MRTIIFAVIAASASAIHIKNHDEDMSVEQARVQAAQMQAQMENAIAMADQKRAEQQTQYEHAIQNDDPASQL